MLAHRARADQDVVDAAVLGAQVHVQVGPGRAGEAGERARSAVGLDVFRVKFNPERQELVFLRGACTRYLGADDLAGVHVIREQVEDLKCQLLGNGRHVARTVHHTVANEIVFGRGVGQEDLRVLDVVRDRFRHVFVGVDAVGVGRHEFGGLGGGPAAFGIRVHKPAAQLNPVVLQFVAEGVLPQEVRLLVQDQTVHVRQQRGVERRAHELDGLHADPRNGRGKGVVGVLLACDAAHQVGQAFLLVHAAGVLLHHGEDLHLFPRFEILEVARRFAHQRLQFRAGLQEGQAVALVRHLRHDVGVLTKVGHQIQQGGVQATREVPAFHAVEVDHQGRGVGEHVLGEGHKVDAFFRGDGDVLLKHAGRLGPHGADFGLFPQAGGLEGQFLQGLPQFESVLWGPNFVVVLQHNPVFEVQLTRREVVRHGHRIAQHHNDRLVAWHKFGRVAGVALVVVPREREIVSAIQRRHVHVDGAATFSEDGPRSVHRVARHVDPGDPLALGQVKGNDHRLAGSGHRLLQKVLHVLLNRGVGHVAFGQAEEVQFEGGLGKP